MRQLSNVEIEEVIASWIKSSVKEDSRIGRLLIRPTILTEDSCLFLSNETGKILEKTEVKTEFELVPHIRNLWKDLLESYGGNVLIIAMAMPYKLSQNMPKKGFGFVDGVAAYDDYHKIMRAYFEELEVSLSKLEGYKGTCDVHVDTSPYIDRDVGYWCGLGKYGKHHQLMNEGLGGHFNIGYMVMPWSIETVEKASIDQTYASLIQKSNTSKLFSPCESCTACVKACPSHICGHTIMAREKCLSYITQTKRAITDSQRHLMGNRLYGCSHCQYDCPYSQIESDDGVGDLPLDDILNLTQRAFKSRFGDLGFAWRGLTILKRNALIVMNNQGLELSQEQYDKIKNKDNLRAYIPKYKEA